MVIYTIKSTNNYKKYLILTLSAFASLPLLYVANASLIENMSICFGIIFITLLKYQHKQKIKPYILILFILILSIIKKFILPCNTPSVYEF